eukprot:CAMPEP_0114496450 /NCGR_PEP_ID=MMETSP0109-20121206/5776_1 /TAXON_ID=29199 /ORGANISM="Chlorarachnion reptans, Strain CCCM449" /LENGTH=217 /DNA_ID=CAMNT_0001673723 /DNA_START=99 /DNA_END=750 /DNA_ORIENTATION=-
MVSLREPSLNSISEGMLRIPNFVAVSGDSSVFIFTVSIRPSYSLLISSMRGSMSRQGPHQGAQKSTSTGIADLSTTSEKLLSSTSMRARASVRRGQLAGGDIPIPTTPPRRRARCAVVVVAAGPPLRARLNVDARALTSAAPAPQLTARPTRMSAATAETAQTAMRPSPPPPADADARSQAGTRPSPRRALVFLETRQKTPGRAAGGVGGVGAVGAV